MAKWGYNLQGETNCFMHCGTAVNEFLIYLSEYAICNMQSVKKMRKMKKMYQV